MNKLAYLEGYMDKEAGTLDKMLSSTPLNEINPKIINRLLGLEAPQGGRLSFLGDRAKSLSKEVLKDGKFTADPAGHIPKLITNAYNEARPLTKEELHKFRKLLKSDKTETKNLVKIPGGIPFYKDLPDYGAELPRTTTLTSGYRPPNKELNKIINKTRHDRFRNMKWDKDMVEYLNNEAKGKIKGIRKDISNSNMYEEGLVDELYKVLADNKKIRESRLNRAKASSKEAGRNGGLFTRGLF